MTTRTLLPGGRSQSSSFYFAEEPGSEERFPLPLEHTNSYERSLELDKSALEQINFYRDLNELEALRWSPFMNGKAIEISFRQLNEGKFMLETNEDHCYATSFIVRTTDAKLKKLQVMDMGLSEARRRGLNLRQVYLRSVVGSGEGAMLKFDAGVAVIVVEEFMIMVTTVVGIVSND
ncbi:hypothetical protein FGB62_99g111 [Gracilaria domingensis]|nr:hypothetical protein FGB62_99g111 [Gracilaria domingensis]